MLLLIDIGNTDTKIGLSEKGLIKDILRIGTLIGRREVVEYSYILESFMQHHRMKKPQGAVVCSVVPEVTAPFLKAVNQSFGLIPLHVDHKIKTRIRFPAGIGADRIAQAVAANKIYKENIIVVAFGTATVFSVITADGKYLGGAIMPGIEMSISVLAGRTAQLPGIKLKIPENILSKQTENNILTGVILGHAGAVERITDEIREYTGRDFKILITGGLSRFVRPYLRAVDYENPDLTFEGLRIIYGMNIKKAQRDKGTETSLLFQTRLSGRII